MVRVPDDGAAIDAEAEAALERVIGATQALRRWRDDLGVKQGRTLAASLDADGYGGLEPLLSRIARLELRERARSTGGQGGAGEAASIASVTIPGGALHVLDGVDLAAHAERRERERTRARRRDRARCARSSRTRRFVANAPAEVVAAEREKLARLQAELEAL